MNQLPIIKKKYQQKKKKKKAYPQNFIKEYWEQKKIKKNYLIKIWTIQFKIIKPF